MFKCYKADGNGFRMRFKNGYEVSVRFGNENYCDNYGIGGKFLVSHNAEIIVMSPDGQLVELDEENSFLANQTPEDLAEIMNKYANM